MNNELIIHTKKRDGLILMVQNVSGTEVWAVVEKGELSKIVEKARKYDILAEMLQDEPIEFFRRQRVRTRRIWGLGDLGGQGTPGQ